MNTNWKSGCILSYILLKKQEYSRIKMAVLGCLNIKSYMPLLPLIHHRGIICCVVFSKKYIVDEQNRRIAVQIPIETFERLEEVLENYALVQLMKESEGEDTLGPEEAKRYYG